MGTAPMAILVWTFVSMQDLAFLFIAWARDTFGTLLKVEDYRFGEVYALTPDESRRCICLKRDGKSSTRPSMLLNNRKSVCWKR